MRYSGRRAAALPALLPHPLQIHQDMFLSLIQRRIPKKDDEDPKEDPANYPTNRDDDDEEEEEEEPSGYDADDEDEDEDEEEEEEEKHPAPADSVPPVHRMTARISIRAEPSILLPPREEPYLSVGLSSHDDPAESQGPIYYAPPSGTPPLLPIPAPISSPPVLLPSTNCRADRPEDCLPPRKRLCVTQGPRYKVGESSSTTAARLTGGRRTDYGFVDTMNSEIRRWRAEEVGYGIRDAWVDSSEAAEEIAPITLKGVNTRVTKLAAVQK
ncbi:hypothetical protein Tco_1195368 [Tanacetum coccineum]